MAGSTTQSMENFTAQGMERHQMMMNTEVMKHFRIMNRASVREIMLQHERTFKEQVHDLHKLYEVQRLLMERAKSRGMDGYTGATLPPPPPPRACGNAVPEEINYLGHRRNFWEQVTPESKGAMATQPAISTEKAFPDKNMKFEETSKNSNSPVRKRKIDLEQLPEDDSEDDMETSVDALNSSLSGSSREYYHGHPALESGIKSQSAPYPGAALKPLQQPVMESQSINVYMGESSVYTNHGDGSGRGSLHPFQHGKAPSLPVNMGKTQPNLANLGHVTTNTSFPNAGSMNIGVGATIKSSTMFLPQADLIDRASQEAGRDTHWFFQAAEGNSAGRFFQSPPLQQQQQVSPHLALSELSTSRSLHPLNGVFQNAPNPENSHHTNKSQPLVSVSIGEWNKEHTEKPLSGLLVGGQKDRPSFTSAERLGDSSLWFPKEPVSQGPLDSVAPMARLETRPAEVGSAMPGIVAPGITVSHGKGSSQERDLSLWPTQNPILQLPQQYQKPQIFQPPQVFPPVSQGVWLPPPQSAPSGMYSQQMVYGVLSSDSSQIGHRNDLLQRSQGELAGPWNMVGLGHYYSSVPSNSQKPPFKKPPKLILKNDGVGMELKLVSPDKEISDKATQKKPLNSFKKDPVQDISLNSFKKDPVQDISRSLEKKLCAQKGINDVDQKVDRRASFGIQFSSSVVQGREPLRATASGPLEPKLMTTATSSRTQEIVLPKESPFLHDATATVALSSITQSNAGTTHSMFAAGLILSASPERPSVLQAPARGSVMQNVSSTESPKATFLDGTLPLMGSGINTDMPDQKAERSLLLCKDDISADHCSMPDPEAFSAKGATSKASTKDSVKNMPDQKAERSLLLCKDDISADHCSMPDPEAFCAKGATSKASTKDSVKNSQPEPPSVVPQGAPSNVQDESALVANTSEKRVLKSDGNHCQEDEHSKEGSHLTPCASAESPTKDAAQYNGVHGRIADLGGIPSSMQTVSIQSSTPATPTSDRACSSTRSSTSLVPESNTESKAAASCDDLHLDFDTDNLAASILLSFAPKIDIPNEEKHVKADASAISCSSRRDRPGDQTSSSSRKDGPSDQGAPSKAAHGVTGLRTQTLNSGGSQDRKIHGQGSFKRSDRLSHHEPTMKATKKDRLRTDKRNVDDPEVDNGCDDAMKSLTIKLPRVAGLVNGEALPMSRSKQLSKINGVTVSPSVGDRTTAFNGNDMFHTPTGRRSSRGPPIAARVLHDSGSRSQQQTRYRLEGSSNTTTERDSMSREEAAVNRNKAEANMKSKAWGELNKTRSHPRNKQSQENSHRKTQR